MEHVDTESAKTSLRNREVNLQLSSELFQLIFVHQLQRPTASTADTGKRIVGDNYRQAGLLHQQPIQIAQ